MSRTPKPVHGIEKPILVIGDSNFTRFPFSNAPWANIARGGLRFDRAAKLAHDTQLRPERVKAVVLGLGINETRIPNEELLRKQMRDLKTTIESVYPGTPIFHFQAPAEKFEGERCERVKLANKLAREVFKHLTVKPQVIGTNDPHYTDRERRDLAKLVLSFLRKQVPELARLSGKQ